MTSSAMPLQAIDLNRGFKNGTLPGKSGLPLKAAMLTSP